MPDLWDARSAVRISRRRVLSGIGAGSAAAAFLAACGGGEDKPGQAQPSAKSDKSGLLATPRDTSDKATPGGTLNLSIGRDTEGFDALSAVPITPAMHNEYTYARLVSANKIFNLAKGESMDATVDSYAAESWEQSPDGLQLTFKLRANGGLDPRPPTNGRNLDAQDVVFAYNRYKATGRSRGLVSNELNKDAPVISVTAVDPRTVLV